MLAQVGSPSSSSLTPKIEHLFVAHGFGGGDFRGKPGGEDEAEVDDEECGDVEDQYGDP